MRTSRDAEYVEYVTARLPALHRAAYVLCSGDADLADDVVQCTITRLYQRWRRVSRADNIDAYVHRMLVNTFVDEKRQDWSKVRLVPSVFSDAVSGTGSNVEDRDALVAALRTLPPRQRAVLVLRFLLDRPVEEVAEILACSTGTVKSQTSRGLAVLRDLLVLKDRAG